jgi:hypothetical protein
VSYIRKLHKTIWRQCGYEHYFARIGTISRIMGHSKKSLDSRGGTTVPDLFRMASAPLSYRKLYEALEVYCQNSDSELNLVGLSLGGVNV